MVISLNLQAPYTDVSASIKAVPSGLTYARLSGQWSGTLSITNTSGAALNGPLQIALSGLPAGVTLVNASGNRGGVPYLTANTGSLAAGATLSVPVSFTKTGTAAISYTTQVYSGTF